MGGYCICGVQQPTYYALPSVAEESKAPILESISRFLDSSATLGMASFNKFRMSGRGVALPAREGRLLYFHPPAILKTAGFYPLPYGI